MLFERLHVAVRIRRSTYRAIRSTSRLTRTPGARMPSVVTSRVCGIRLMAKLRAVDFVDGEADAVERHRTLARDVARQRCRRRELDAQRARIVRVARHFSDAVDVARYPMTAEAVPARSAGSRFTRAPSRLAPSVVTRSVSPDTSARKLSPSEFGHRQAHAVDADAVAEIQSLTLDACESPPGAIAGPGGAAAAPLRLNLADFLHQPVNICASYFFFAGSPRREPQAHVRPDDLVESSNLELRRGCHPRESRERGQRFRLPCPNNFGARYSSHSSTNPAANKAPSQPRPGFHQHLVDLQFGKPR